MIFSDFQLWTQRGRTPGGIFSPFLRSSASRIPHFVSVMFVGFWVRHRRRLLPASQLHTTSQHLRPTAKHSWQSVPHVLPQADLLTGAILLQVLRGKMPSHLWARMSCSWGLCGHCSLSSSVEGYFVRHGTFPIVSTTWLSRLAILKILYTKNPETLWRYWERICSWLFCAKFSWDTTLICRLESS